MPGPTASMTELPVSRTGWEDIQSSLASLKDLLDACYSAWGPDDQKVSVTTKKRIAVRALKGLEQGQELLKVLSTNLQELEQSSRQWEQNVMQASRSHKDLMQQLEHTSDDLHGSQARLRHAEADRLAAQHDMEQLRKQLAAAAADKEALTETIMQMERDLQAANHGANEANCHLSELRGQVDQLAAATKEAEAAAAAAVGALTAAQQEAEKERAARRRHEDAIARLTADNLVFMAKLRAAEQAAEAAAVERDELLLALEEHKGPWMDEVHQGVERRVKEALARAEQLEQQQELTAKQTAEQVAQLQQQQADLEAELAAARRQHAELEQHLATAKAAEAEARIAAEEAQTLAAEAQAVADARAADLRVAQDSLKTMREECNERWMSERSARAQLAEQQTQLESAEADLAKLKKSLQSRSDDLMTQRAVNQQLMLKKEEVEWQLMAAIAKLNAQEAQQSGSPQSITESSSSPAPAAHSTDITHDSPWANMHHSAGTAAMCECESVQLPIGAPADATAYPNVNNSGQQLLKQSESGSRSPVKAVAVGSPPLGSSCGACGAVASPAAVHLPHDTFSALEAAASGKSPFALVPAAPFSPAGSPSPAAVHKPPINNVTRNVNNIITSGIRAAGGLRAQSSMGSTSASGKLGSTPNHSLPPSRSNSAAAAAAPRPSAFTSAAGAATAAAAAGLSCNPTPGLAGSLSLPLPPLGPLAGTNSINSVPDMFSLPSLSYGLATLPPPELLAAAAAAAGGGQLGRAGSLSLAGTNSSSTAGVFSPVSSVRSKAVVVGATGGLMAPFSPLPRAPSNSFAASIGAVFPACATASVVTDTEQFDAQCLSRLLPSLVPKQQPNQQQQQLLSVGVPQAPAAVGLAIGSSSGLTDGHPHHHRKTGRPVSAPGGAPCPSTDSAGQICSSSLAGGDSSAGAAADPGAASSPLDGTAAVGPAMASSRSTAPGAAAAAVGAGSAAVCSSQLSVYPVHPLFASSPRSSPTAAAAASMATPGLATVAELSVHVPAAAADVTDSRGTVNATAGAGSGSKCQQQQHNSSSSSAAGQLHGILINGRNSRPRSRSVSPAPSRHGVSPSGSMKSVRFSFENLDQNLDGEVIGHTDRNQKRGSDTGATHNHRRGSHGLTAAHKNMGYNSYGRGYDSTSPRDVTESVSSRAHARELEDLLSSIRSSASTSPGADRYSDTLSPRSHAQQQQDMPPWMLQQRREQAKAAAMAAAAAAKQSLVGNVVDAPLPKRAPVHPVFGTMAWAGGSSSSSPVK